MPIRTGLLTLLVAALVAVPAAQAGPPGKWTQLGDANLANIDQVALARTADGTLHAVWTIPAANNDTLVHDAIGANGTAAVPNVITGGWAAISNTPDVVANAGGLRVIFGGIRTTNSGEVNSNENTATSTDGNAWDLFPGTIVKGDSAYGSDVGAALLSDGTPLFAWGGTGSGVFVHRGLDQGTAKFPVQGQLGGCCGYSPDVAVDTESGSAFVTWASNATNNSGVFAQSLDPATGTPTGAFAKMPASTTLFNGNQQFNQMLQRVPIVARAGGGVYVAYPTGYPTRKQVRLWRIADSKSAVVASTKQESIASITADAEGRLWVLWAERGDPPLVFARRSNKAATEFGPAVKIKAPKGQQSAFKIDGNGQASGALDIVALLGSSAGKHAQWHTQILPGLDLSASPSKINGDKSTKVEFAVSDPEPVKGAKVKAGGKTATTDSKGHATITLGPSKAKSISATATKSGYTPGTDKVKVK